MSALPPILLTLAFGAGLATGLLHFWAPVGVAGVLLLWALGTRRSLPALLSMAVLLGALEATVAWKREAMSCAARLPGAEIRLRVRLLEPVDSGGGRVLVQPLRAGCIGEVSARWPAAQALATGFEAEVTGRWIPREGGVGRPDGTLVASAARVVGGNPSYADKIRTWLGRSIRRLYGARAPMVEALILARRGGIDPALQDKFAQSGLVHLLSISGFHVGLLAGWVFLACRALRAARERALIVAAMVAAGYVAFLGWPPPATRAAALGLLLAWCQIRQRKVQPDPLLSCTCLCVMLVDPWAVLDLGAWLSAAALWGATTCARWTDRVLGEEFWWRCLGSSIGATLATAPITAAALGTVAPVGIGLNFAAIPVAAVGVPGVFASLLVLPLWGTLAGAFAAGAGFALHLLELLASLGAWVPGGHLVTEPGIQAAWPWALGLATLVWGLWSRSTLGEAARRWGWVLAAALWLALVPAHWPGGGDDGRTLALHFLNVGQGDGAVIRTPHGHFVVVDAGPKTEAVDAGRRVVVPFLSQQGVAELSAMVISHAHADHVGGASAVLERFHTDLVLEPGMPFSDPVYIHFLDEVAAEGVPWRPGHPGDRFVLDGVAFSLLHPDSTWPGLGEDLNEDSLILLVEYGSFRALFPGDAGLVAEGYLHGRVGRVDLLKVGHHGSRTATGDAWLDELHPKAAVVSVGRNNYGHPAPGTLDRLQQHGVPVWRTDRDGQVDVTTDGNSMTVKSQRRTVNYPLESGQE